MYLSPLSSLLYLTCSCGRGPRVPSLRARSEPPPSADQRLEVVSGPSTYIKEALTLRCRESLLSRERGQPSTRSMSSSRAGPLVQVLVYSSALFVAVVPVFQSHFTVLRPSRGGCGRSPVPGLVPP